MQCRNQHMVWISLSVLVVMVCGGCILSASASRLSELIKEPPTLYLPARLLLGQTGKLIVKAPAGHTVVVAFSPPVSANASGEVMLSEDEGVSSVDSKSPFSIRPDGKLKKVGRDCQTLEMVANEKGVAVFPITVPDAPQLEGQRMVLDGYTVSPDCGVVEGLAWLDPMGRSTQRNEVIMETVANITCAMIMPVLPGIGAGMARQLGTLRDVSSGGERMKDLVDDGSRGTTILDRNSFIKRVDGVGSAGP